MSKKTFFIPITMDLSAVQNKIFMGLTLRQIIFFGLGLAIGFLMYQLTKEYNMDLATILLMIVAAPFIVFGFYNRDGLYLEDVINNYIECNFLRTSIREKRKIKRKEDEKKRDLKN